MGQNKIDEAINYLVGEGVIDIYHVRNYRIKQRYKELRYKKKLSCKAARESVACEFNVNEKTIQKIIYGDNRV